ncbi:MAG: arginine deiminase, partial [Gemmatimonadetes bacterium]|nr:arginine deiminase [Gemmatimonadota bacterium]NIU30418.1 arginine deiminase [Gemmatimonadota bacterium]NIV60809.1 arginine deiminase [Gemmatimonadota bacterium]
MTHFGVDSEVGRLRKVIVHRPDLSLKRLTPSNVRELLFDDVVWVRRAGEQHDAFVQLMRERGIEVYLLGDLLTETLETSPRAKEQVLDSVVHELTVGVGLVEEMRALLAEMPARELATHLIGGLTKDELQGIDLTHSLTARSSAEQG